MIVPVLLYRGSKSGGYDVAVLFRGSCNREVYSGANPPDNNPRDKMHFVN